MTQRMLIPGPESRGGTVLFDGHRASSHRYLPPWRSAVPGTDLAHEGLAAQHRHSVWWHLPVCVLCDARCSHRLRCCQSGSSRTGAATPGAEPSRSEVRG
eukprot:1777060-Rhodomonas_salina.1